MDPVPARAGRIRLQLLDQLGQVAAHLDHRLDPDSPRRAAAACRLAAALAVPLVTDRLAPTSQAGRGGESVEAWARRRRYEFLDRVARARGARFIATAHHAEDQAETVLLRLLHGSGLDGGWSGSSCIECHSSLTRSPLVTRACSSVRASDSAREIASMPISEPFASSRRAR